MRPDEARTVDDRRTWHTTTRLGDAIEFTTTGGERLRLTAAMIRGGRVKLVADLSTGTVAKRIAREDLS